GRRPPPHDAGLLVRRPRGEDAGEDRPAVGPHRVGDAGGVVGDVLGPPPGPQPVERHQSFDRTSARSRSTKSSTGTSRSGRSDPRALTPHVPLATSSSPTTSTYGSFSSFARRMRAPSGSSAATESARKPSATSRSTMRTAYSSWS